MAGFLSKTRQKVEHTGKINLGEFKLLGSVIGNEKTLLNSHVRASADCKKAAAALDEWAQAEGVDLTDTLGKVAKLLGNDLARAEEEYAEHLNSYRLYFKGLREREEKFSQLKKNKNSLQSKIDSAEKKLAKTSPENKDLPNLTTRLQELKSEMIGMEHAVINEDAAIAAHRRHTARSAVAHKLGALCQLGEKMTIIGELGKLLVSEIPVSEPGQNRGIYTSHERTQQIYGEAQTCLHGVKFDSAPNGEASADQLPVPAVSHEYDQSYDYDQEAPRQDGYLNEQRQEAYPAQADEQPGYVDGDGVRTYEKGATPLAGTAEETPSRSYQPLSAPNHENMENEFSDAVNAGWTEQQQQQAGYNTGATPYGLATETIREQEETPTVSSLPKFATPTGGSQVGADEPTHAQQNREAPSLREAEQELSHHQTVPTSTSQGYDARPTALHPEQSHESFTPSGDDLYGTGIYGNTTAESPRQIDEPGQTTAESPVEQIRSHEQSLPTKAEPPLSITTSIDRPYDTSTIVMTPVVRDLQDEERSPPVPAMNSLASQAPPPARPAGPAQSRAPSTSLPRSALPVPGASAVSPTTLTSSTTAPLATKPVSPPVAVSPTLQQKHSYTTLSTSKGDSPVQTPTIATAPASPTRSKPTKQSSYRSENRQSLTKRQDSGEYGQRSSIAYLNDTPRMEPIMKAPPPVTSLGPLPSTSPYFNSYATLRSSSYGKPDAAPLTKATSTSESANRPKISRGDSKLGSKRGYDMKAVQQPAHEKPLLQHPIANVNPGAGAPKDYTYAIHDGSTSSGGRKLNAGAFRRAPARESSFMSTQSGTDGAVSPAQRLRDEWRSSAYSTPLSTPAVDIPEEQAQSQENQSRLSAYTAGMYGERANSAPHGDYTHRTSAIDAPTDVLPNDDHSHSSLQNLAEAEAEPTQPLHVRKRSSAPQEDSTQGNAPPYQQSVGTEQGGFNGNRYVTNLE